MSQSAASITVRRPHFDWSGSQVGVWVPNNPDVTHVLNAMHVLFPEGERAFCRVLSSALEHVDDPAIVADIRGFLAQEGLHARAHQGAFAKLADELPHIEESQKRIARAFRSMLGSHRTSNRYLLMWRLASVAAIEHLTTAIGEWTVTGERFDEHGCDPQMVALVKWHGAEEIEHRSVAFDAHRAVQRRLAHPTRVLAMVFWLPMMTLLWAVSAQTLLKHSQAAPRRRVLSFGAVRRGITEGLVPNIPGIARGAVDFCRRSYHPSHHVSPEVVAAAQTFLTSDVAKLYTSVQR